MTAVDVTILNGQPTEEELVTIAMALQVLQQSNEPQVVEVEPVSRWGLAARLSQPVSPWLKSISAWQASGRTPPSWPV